MYAYKKGERPQTIEIQTAVSPLPFILMQTYVNLTHLIYIEPTECREITRNSNRRHVPVKERVGACICRSEVDSTHGEEQMHQEHKGMN